MHYRWVPVLALAVYVALCLRFWNSADRRERIVDLVIGIGLCLMTLPLWLNASHAFYFVGLIIAFSVLIFDTKRRRSRR